MAAGISQSLANSINNALVNGIDWSWDTAYVALLTTASSATAFGTEATGGSYARQPVSGGTPAAGVVESDANVLFTNMPACTVAGISLCNAASGAPTEWLFIDGLSQAVTGGENLSINTADLTITGS